MKSWFKTYSKYLMLFLVGLIATIAVMAQVDSTTAQNTVNDLIGLAESHYKWVAPTVAVIAIISELLALIPSNKIPANGILDAILKIIKWIAKANPKK